MRAASDNAPDDAPQGWVSTEQVAALAGVTKRQVDYWIRTTDLDATNPAAGSGSARRFSYADAVTVALLAELVSCVAVSQASRFELADLVAAATSAEWGSELVLSVGATTITVDVDAVVDRVRDGWPPPPVIIAIGQVWVTPDRALQRITEQLTSELWRWEPAATGQARQAAVTSARYLLDRCSLAAEASDQLEIR